MTESVSRETLLRLSRRRDDPARLHLGFQCLALIVSTTTTLWLSASGSGVQWLGVGATAICIVTFFPLLHESGHQTAFETHAWNEIGCWIAALMMLQAPSFFREFHWEHHRSTQDQEHDPEISSAPALLYGWPTHPIAYLAVASGQHILFGKISFTIACALLPESIWSRFFPFIRSDRRRRVASESRFVVLGIGVLIGLGYTYVPGFGRVLLAWPMAHVLLGFYLMSEHTGLGSEGDQFDRTRSVRSNGIVRWLMWNMPYHAEHHAHPGIPYHALPALHDVIESRLKHSSPGYLHFHIEAAARALHLR